MTKNKLLVGCITCIALAWTVPTTLLFGWFWLAHWLDWEQWSAFPTMIVMTAITAMSFIAALAFSFGVADEFKRRVTTL